MSTKYANDQTFPVFVSNGSHIGKVLVIFFEENNIDCEKTFEMVAGLDTVYSVVKVNKKDSGKMVKFFRVSVFPTLILFKKGQQISRIEGLPKSQLHINNLTQEVKEIKPLKLKPKSQ